MGWPVAFDRLAHAYVMVARSHHFHAR